MAVPNRDDGYTSAVFRAYYDAEGDVVRVTSSDSDFGPGGVALVAPRGSSADRALRRALARGGVPTSPSGGLDFARLPERVRPADADPGVRFLLGGTAGGGALTYSLDERPLLVVGAPGSGKSVLVENLLASVTDLDVDVHLVDAKGELHALAEAHGVAEYVRVEATRTRFEEGTASQRTREFEDYLRRARAVLSERAADVAAREAAPREPRPDVLLVVDDAARLFGPDKAGQRALADLEVVATRGYRVGVLAVVTAQGASDEYLPGRSREWFARVGFYAASPADSTLVIGRLGLERAETGVGVLVGPRGELTAFRTPFER